MGALSAPGRRALRTRWEREPACWREAFLALQAFALPLACEGGRSLHPWVGTQRLGIVILWSLLQTWALDLWPLGVVRTGELTLELSEGFFHDVGGIGELIGWVGLGRYILNVE